MSKQVAEADVVVQGKTERIAAFDLMRGFFLIVIMIDHVELYPNGWDFITGKGRLWVSAAEGFFFLSGLLIGMIYKRRLHLGMKYISLRMWQRAAELWAVGVSLTLIFVAWVEFTHHIPIKDGLPEPFPWHHYIEQALLMRFTYGWGDFLVRFAILMLIAPLVFFLVAKKKWWLALAGMLVAWHFRGQGFTWSWQLIFNGGIIIGFYWQELKRWLQNLKPKTQHYLERTVYGVAFVTFAASYLSVYLLSLLNHLYGNLTPWLRHVTYTWNNYNYDVWVYAQKWTMGPLRVVLFCFWFSTMFLLVNRYQEQIKRYSRGVLELLGRNSLLVYAIHAFIIFGLKMYFIPAQTNFLQNFLITGAGLTLLIGITVLYKSFTSGSGFSRPDKWARSVNEKRRALFASY